MDSYHGTTILSVRRGREVALGGDGQVTLGSIVVKASARKVRRLYKEQVLAGFAGATADAFTLFERFEGKLEKHQGNLVRAAIDLTRDWRTDRVLRRLEALLAAPAIAQRDRHGALGVPLADDVPVEFRDDLARRHGDRAPGVVAGDEGGRSGRGAAVRLGSGLAHAGLSPGAISSNTRWPLV